MLMNETRGEMLTPNPNECNSALTSVTGGLLLYPHVENPQEHSSTDPQTSACTTCHVGFLTLFKWFNVEGMSKKIRNEASQIRQEAGKEAISRIEKSTTKHL